jgi:TPR repeat protein
MRRGVTNILVMFAVVTSLAQLLQPVALAGDPAAQFMLGYAFENGVAGPPDLKVAVRWYREAALQAIKAAQ